MRLGRGGLSIALVVIAISLAPGSSVRSSGSSALSSAYRTQGTRLSSRTPPRRSTDELPAGLTRADWTQIRRSIAESRHHSDRRAKAGEAPDLFNHQAQLFGHGDDDQFGLSVAVSGDTAVIGQPFDDVPGGPEAGSAYVLVRSGTTWTLQRKLLAPDAAAGDNFGRGVAISGNTVIVGAPFATTGAGLAAGAAYVFVWSGTDWLPQQKLTATDGETDAHFGFSVSISGDSAAVGSPEKDNPGAFDGGAIHVFTRTGNTWTEEQRLWPAAGAAEDHFGFSVSLAGDTVVGGAPDHASPAGSQAGSAYVFVRSGTTWTQQQELLASDGNGSSFFGWSVSLFADTAVVGAPYADTPAGQDAGAAYVFERAGTTWTEQQQLLVPGGTGGAVNDYFGWSVSLFLDTVAVGAVMSDAGPGSDAGAVYVFMRFESTWYGQAEIVAPDGSAGDWFGAAASVFQDTLLVGAPQAPGSSDAGSAYVFICCTWPVQQKLTEAEDDTFGHAVSVSGDTVVVGAELDDTPAGVDAGAAYVFVRSAGLWTEQQRLLAPDGAMFDRFGGSVSVQGDTLVVGARGDVTSGQAGAAYVFVRSGTVWSLQQKLLAADGDPNDQFGSSVSISGDTIVVGSALEDTLGLDAGAAYVFVRSGTTWTEQQKLLSSDGTDGDWFGYSVSVSGDTAVVGAFFDDTASGVDAGSAYVFVRSGTTWTPQQQLLAGDGAAGDGFGVSVSVSGDTAVAGAVYADTPGGTDAGSAYVFVRTGGVWTEQQKLLASDGALNDWLGRSVALVGDTLVVGAPAADNGAGEDAGAAYVFARAGTAWSEQQKLVAPDAAPGDDFGFSVAVSGQYVVIGAPYDDTGAGSNAGSAHVFGVPEADLVITKTDGQGTAVPGEPLTYDIVVSNAGPISVTGAAVTDILPAALLAPFWTCSATAGSFCTGAGSGSIDDVVDLLVGGKVFYTVKGSVDAGATGTLLNTATVMPPAGTPDPNPGNNSATDIDTLTPETDLAITKKDSADPVNPGDPLAYDLVITNGGPSNATGVAVVDTLPPGVTFVSSVPGPPTCSFGSGAVSCALGAMAAGASSPVTINVTVDAGTGGILINTATVTGNETDPVPGNNSASAATAAGRKDGELTHGTNEMFDLAALPGPVADEDVFRIVQKPYSSYEIVVDGTSGDIGASDASFLTRVAPDGTTVLQVSAPIGAGFSRSLRWMNTTASANEEEMVRVRSTECTTDCGTDDVYRIRAYETTGSIARFSNFATQVTVLVLNNPTSNVISGYAYFWNFPGTLVATEHFDLPPLSTRVIDTSAVPGADGIAGGITVAHDGRYGDLSGKAVALEPATGFSFDTPLEPRLP